MVSQSMGVGDLLRGGTMKSCPSFPGYSVTADFRVVTHRKRFGKGRGKGGGVNIDPRHRRLMKEYEGAGGYPYVSVSTKRGQRSEPVHVLVADAYHGPRPDGMEVRHLDGDPTNRNPDNLRYGTVAENSADRVRHGRQPRGESHGRARLDETKVRSIRRRYSGGETIAAIARCLCVGESTVRDVVKGRKWTHVK